MTKQIWFVALVVVILGFMAWGGYEKGYSWGLASGYQDGYEAGLGSFPRLDMKDITFTYGENSVYIGQLTVTGEQHIIDKINNLPSIISIK